ncbi:protoporphyrinogen oxidase [Streptomyces capparidis]
MSGLAAAWFLLRGGAEVTVLEASSRLGGKLHADEIAGVPVDLGAESMLARRPEAVDLARAVGLGDDLQPPAASGGALWTRGALRPLPKGHLMGVPGDLAALANSGVLSPRGLARLPLDRVLPRAPLGDDVSVGDLVAARMGREVVDRLVEPLLGGVYAGDAHRISLRTALPKLYEAAREERSLAAAVRRVSGRAPRGEGPVFMGLRGGVGKLPLAIADACRAEGARVETDTTVRELRRTAERPGRGGRWRLVVDRPRGRDILEADAVVLSVPAPAAAALLRVEAPQAAAGLAGVEYASMALVTMAFRRRDAACVPEGSGFLVPPVDGRTIKASTFASRKWRWIDEADDETVVLRTSVGRYGESADLEREDTDLVRLSRADLADAIGLTAAPVAARVTRWNEGLPQYAVGHTDLVARVRAEVGKLPGLAVCGAVYDGVGIPACVASARRAAEALLGDGERPAGGGG